MGLFNSSPILCGSPLLNQDLTIPSQIPSSALWALILTPEQTRTAQDLADGMPSQFSLMILENSCRCRNYLVLPDSAGCDQSSCIPTPLLLYLSTPSGLFPGSPQLQFCLRSQDCLFQQIWGKPPKPLICAHLPPLKGHISILFLLLVFQGRDVGETHSEDRTSE